jgi:hypothetical protein
VTATEYTGEIQLWPINAELSAIEVQLCDSVPPLRGGGRTHATTDAFLRWMTRGDSTRLFDKSVSQSSVEDIFELTD